MSPQQTVMLEALKRRGIEKVVVTPLNDFETKCADATLTRRELGGYSATVEQLKAYYERQSK